MQGLAIISGAGISGLLAAKVLSPHFEKIVILERDTLPAAADYRNGTAQARHAHILLRRGLLGLEDMFPGFTASMLKAGAVMLNATRDWFNLFPMGAFPNFASDYEFICASRPLIEHTLRTILLEQCSNIAIKDNCNVSAIRLHKNLPPQITFHAGAEKGMQETMQADLLVDATGRNSHAPDWLKSQGFGTVKETVVKPYLGYATRLYRGVSMPRFVRATVVLPKDPHMTRGGTLFPIEKDQYICTLYGCSKDYPPTAEDEFLGYAKSLRSDIIYNGIANAEALTSPKAFIKNESTYRYYACQENWPQGFLVIGDAVCSFNPIYGQGMTASVVAAESLSKNLNNGFDKQSNWAAKTQRKIVKAYWYPWTISTNEDLRWPGTEGAGAGIVLRAMHGFTNMLGIAACIDKHVTFTYIKILHMTETPLALLNPLLMARMILAKCRSARK